jgi:6-phosphogluconolactonase
VYCWGSYKSHYVVAQVHVMTRYLHCAVGAEQVCIEKEAEYMSPGEVSKDLPLEEQLRFAAVAMFEVLKDQPHSKPLVIALCGGRSVVGLVQAFLRESVHQPQDLLARIHFFMVDERIVPLTHPDSNFGGLKQQLFDPLVAQGKISQSQLHPMTITLEDARGSCNRYEQALNEYGGAFTIVVLGMGEDGHVAGLFPRHPALLASGNSFIPFFDSPKPPAARVTASRDLVTGAALAVLLALGEGKRAAWNAFISDQVAEQECPAKMVSTMNRVVVVTDVSR